MKINFDDYHLYLERIIDKSIAKSEEIKGISDVNISEGLSGVMILLIKIYTRTLDKKLLKIIKLIADKVFKSSKIIDISLDFYHGLLGVSYMFAYLSSVSQKDKNISRSKLILKRLNIEDNIASIYYSDLFGGKSGILIGLMKINNFYKHEISLDNIFNEILKHAKIDSQGIRWESRSHQIRELCGMAHGVSGIAYSLAVYGQSIDNNGITLFARKSIEYENSYLKRYKIWPDLRLPMPNHQQEIFDGYFKGKSSTPHFYETYCNGFSGIGINRILLFQKFKDKRLLQDLAIIRGNIENYLHKSNDISLCCGLCSMVLFLLIDFKVLKNNQSRILMHNTITSTRMKKKIEECEDISLLNGLSGFLYLLFYSNEVDLDRDFVFFDNDIDQTGSSMIFNYQEEIVKLKYPKTYALLTIDTQMTYRTFFKEIWNNNELIKSLYLEKRINVFFNNKPKINLKLFLESYMCDYVYKLCKKAEAYNRVFDIELTLNKRIYIEIEKNQNTFYIQNLNRLNEVAVPNDILEIISMFKKSYSINKCISNICAEKIETRSNIVHLLSILIQQKILIPLKSKGNKNLIYETVIL